MRGLTALKIILTLFFITTYSYNLSAQNIGGQNDSVKRTIVIVRPGYNDQSSNYSNHSNSSKSNYNSGGTTDLKATSTTLSTTNIETKRDTIIIKTDTLRITTAKHTSNRILFLELGGPGLALSLNYDQRFSGGKEGWGYRIGMGYFGDGGNTVFTIPLQVNYLIGSNGKYFEFGGGTTFLNTTGDNTGKTFIFDRITGFIGTATIGVRYEPEKSLNFRLGFVPIFSNDEIIYAGGFSVGYTF